MKDYIDIIDSNGKIIKMEVVSIFKLKEYDFNYIIYKELDGINHYVAKYKGSNIVELDTSLSSKEL